MLRSIHLLLIPAILTCPLLCTGGAGGMSAACCQRAEASRDAEHARPCCAAHADDLPRTAGEEPVPADDEPADSCCQCICGGAILGDAPAVDAVNDARLAWAAEVLPSLVSNLPQWDDSIATQRLFLIGDRTAVSGRHLRHLYMSLLC